MTTDQFQPRSPLHPTVLIDSADHAVHHALSDGPSREVIHRAIGTAEARVRELEAETRRLREGG